MLTGVAESELKSLHQRLALIQELTRRPRYGAGRSPGSDTDSVEQMVFDFFDGRLFRVTVHYDRKQTEGLTDADMIEAISIVYGSPAKAVVARGRQFAATSNDEADDRRAAEEKARSINKPIFRP